jgi:hypothetical protein
MDDRLVGNQAEGGQGGQDRACRARCFARRVDVFHAHQPPPAGMARA